MRNLEDCSHGDLLKSNQSLASSILYFIRSLGSNNPFPDINACATLVVSTFGSSGEVVLSSLIDKLKKSDLFSKMYFIVWFEHRFQKCYEG